ncbi:MAG: hypothetical protein WD800_05320 [Dehalococcoidia bacterium]
MRRTSILVLLVALLAAPVAVLDAPRAEAKDGDPGDTCSQAPDRPFGWLFTAACGAHDDCVDVVLPEGVAGRLDCDDAFLDALLEAPHEAGAATCRQSVICRILAGVYHRVVRFFTERFGPPSVDEPRAARDGEGRVRLDTYRPYVIERVAPAAWARATLQSASARH